MGTESEMLTGEDLRSAFEKKQTHDDQLHRDQLGAIQGLAEEIRGLALSVTRQRSTPESGGSNWAIATFTTVILSLGILVFSAIGALRTEQVLRGKIATLQVAATELRSKSREVTLHESIDAIEYDINQIAPRRILNNN